MSNPTGYKSGVESVADNIAMDIIQHGTSTSNSSELANMYCSKIEGGCNSQELSELNRTINNLPIYSSATSYKSFLSSFVPLGTTSN